MARGRGNIPPFPGPLVASRHDGGTDEGDCGGNLRGRSWGGFRDLADGRGAFAALDPSPGGAVVPSPVRDLLQPGPRGCEFDLSHAVRRCRGSRPGTGAAPVGSEVALPARS